MVFATCSCTGNIARRILGLHRKKKTERFNRRIQYNSNYWNIPNNSYLFAESSWTSGFTTDSFDRSGLICASCPIQKSSQEMTLETKFNHKKHFSNIIQTCVPGWYLCSAISIENFVNVATNMSSNVLQALWHKVSNRVEEPKPTAHHFFTMFTK